MNVYIYTINHERAWSRHLLARAGLIMMGVPEDKIHYFYAPDHENYESVEEVCDAAAADGFMEFVTSLPTSRRSKIITAQIWGYFQLFLQLRYRDETAMYIHDDAYLIMPFWKYEGMVGLLQGMDSEFRFLGLSSSQSVRESQPSSYGPYIKGFAAGVGDYANVIGPGFYDYAIKHYFEQDKLTFDDFLWDHAYHDPQPAGVYTLPAELQALRFPRTVLPTMIWNETPTGDEVKA